MTSDNWIAACWPAPDRVRAGTTTRNGGFSGKPYESFNLALHVGDDTHRVKANRDKLIRDLDLPSDPLWLTQVHGDSVIDASRGTGTAADACFTTATSIVCAVLTADCIPLLICNRSGTSVAAIHAGWRGLCRGIIANSIGKFSDNPDQLLAWLGPCISAAHYQVREDMRNTCIQTMGAEAASAFAPSGNGRWFADINTLAATELKRLGLTAIYNSNRCTYAEADVFYSYRRDGDTGRMASLIWMAV